MKELSIEYIDENTNLILALNRYQFKIEMDNVNYNENLGIKNIIDIVNISNTMLMYVARIKENYIGIYVRFSNQNDYISVYDVKFVEKVEVKSYQWIDKITNHHLTPYVR